MLGEVFAWEAYEHGTDLHPNVDPTKLELMYQEFKDKKENFKSDQQKGILEKVCGGGAKKIREGGSVGYVWQCVNRKEEAPTTESFMEVIESVVSQVVTICAFVHSHLIEYIVCWILATFQSAHRCAL